MQNQLKDSFHIMAKPTGASCNLHCSYCFYRSKEKLYDSTQIMSDTVLESYIRQLIALEPSNQVTFAWQGGEPTLAGLEFYRRAARIASKYVRKGMQIQWIIQTNGILLSDEWCDFFIKNNYLVGLSLDGPAQIHNEYRTDKTGKGTFEKVMHAVDLLNKHSVEYNIICCVHSGSHNNGRNIYRFLRDEASARYIQFIPIVERLVTNGKDDYCESKGMDVTTRSVGSKEWGQFLIDVFEEWVHNDVGRVFVPIFDWTLASWIGMESPVCIFQSQCGKALVIERNGDLYSCDHYVDREHLLGNILEVPLANLLALKRQQAFGAKKSDLPNKCQECEFKFACNGECPKNRFFISADSNKVSNYLCAGYKNFFNYVNKPMHEMANLLLSGRSADMIMH